MSVETKPAASGPLAHALRWALPAVYLAVLIAPAYAFFSVRGGVGFLAGSDVQAFAAKTFPLVGLYAFTLVWFQFMLRSSLDAALGRLVSSLAAFGCCR